ncbi:MAG: glycerate kinase [Clostridia bacterium]|nr:glycerate kinase [Clostridia bacterium]
MEILNYALGVRFDTRKFPQGDAMHHAFELLYSVLSYTELCNIKVHGGFPYSDEPHTYVVVFDSPEYKYVRKIFLLLKENTALSLFLTDENPYLDKNRLIPLSDMTCYGGYDYVQYKLPNAPTCVYNSVPCPTRAKMNGRNFSFLFAPDSFKGSISAVDAVRLLTLAATETHYRGCKVMPLPVADGGEGTLYAMCAILGGELRSVKTHDPLGREITAQYAIINGDTALIEMAQASGLTLLSPEERNARKTSSYGTGELIMDAIRSGYRKVIVALGGSATNDGGMGCAEAMGIKFTDKDGIEIPPCGDGLIFVRNIDTSNVPHEVRETEFRVMSDVKNPLTGIEGATMVFSEQKGADAVTMFELECGMKNYRRFLNNTVGYDICKKPGAGAAGGMGAMLMTFFCAKMQSGIETLLSLAKFDKMLKNTSLVVTGEGRFDSQTLRGGKAVAGIIKHARGERVPVAVLCGSAGAEALKEVSDTGVITLAHSFIDRDDAMENAKDLFYDAAVNLFTLLRSGYNMKRRFL